MIHYIMFGSAAIDVVHDVRLAKIIKKVTANEIGKTRKAVSVNVDFNHAFGPQ